MIDNVIVTHTKHDNIASWNQANIDAQIALGNLPPGTVVNDVVVSSDWNANHTIAGMTQLLSSLRDYVIIDMGGGNYTMTATEAVAYLKIILNEGTGSTLTWPTVADAYTAIDQSISMQYASHSVTLASQTGGSTVTLNPGLRYSGNIFVIPGVTVASKLYNDSPYFRQGTNGVNVQGGNYTALADDAGKLIVFNAFSGALTISQSSTTDYGDSAVIYVTAQNIPSTFSVVAGAGVTINGSLIGLNNNLLTLQRDGSTNTWYSTSSRNDLLGVTATASSATVYPTFVSSSITGDLPVYSSSNLAYQPSTGTLTPKIVKVDDDAYAAGWSGSLAVPTKNAVYNKIQTLGGGGDMVLASAQTNTGVKTFLDLTMGLRNVANTFTSFFTNTNTASRTYTLKDASGTLAFTSDITSASVTSADLSMANTFMMMGA